MPALFCCATTTLADDGILTLGTGVDYSTGKYGGSVATDILYVPLYVQGRLLGHTELWDSRGRREGLARRLMEQARVHAAETGAARIDLETAVDNLPAQRLYKDLGYAREQQFFKYSLPID